MGEERGLRNEQREDYRERERQFEEKEGLRDPPFIEFSRSDPTMQPLLLQVSEYDKLELKHQNQASWRETKRKNMCHW